MKGQWDNVVLALSERRNDGGDGIDAPIEVVSEFLFLNELFEILVGGADDTDIYLNVFF